MSNQLRRCNAQGLDLIKRFEKLALIAYRCPAGVWTIGYGHTNDVKRRDVINQEQAFTLLDNDIKKFERGVNERVKVFINDNQFSALVSLVFNIGLGAFEKSMLLSLLNRGWHDQVPSQMRRWRLVDGKVMPGLITRREAEIDLWNTPIIQEV